MLNFFSFTQVTFYLYFIYFLFASIVSFLIPGLVLLNWQKNNLNRYSQLNLSLVLGLVSFALISYLVNSIRIPQLIYLYLLIMLILFLKKKLWHQFKNQKNQVEIFNKFSYLIIFLGSLLQLLAVFGSGMRYHDGLRFYWLNGADGIFHLSLIDSIKQSFPPKQPGAWDLPVTNYHYLSNLLIAKFTELWNLPVSSTFFQYFPIVLAPLLGLCVATLLREWQAKKTAVNWGLFFLYFSADSGWFFDYLISGRINWQTSTIDSGIIQFLNMPQALAKLSLLAGLLLFSLYRREKKSYFGLLATILFISLVSFKIYFGIFIALAYSIFVIFKLFQTKLKIFIKNEKALLLFFVLLGLGSAILFFPTNKEAGGLFYAPFAWPKLFVTQLGWQDWLLRMQVYEAHNNFRNIFILEVIATAVFLIAIFGVRLVGLMSFWPKLRKGINPDTFVLIYPSLFILIFLGISTLQVSGGHNVFNFFVVALTVLSLLSAIVIGNFRLHPLLITLIVLFTLPKTTYTAYSYLRNYKLGYDYTLISKDRLDAYQFLRKNYQGKLIQGHTDNFLVKETPEIHMFSGQNTFLDGIGILESHNQPIKDKQLLLKDIFKAKQATVSAQALLKSEIELILIDKSRGEKIGLFLPVLDKLTKQYYIDPLLVQSKTTIFTNQEIEIYEINKAVLKQYLIKSHIAL